MVPNFIKEKQFLEDGRCHFRYPKLYPIDIHDQAQGIIIFSKLRNFNENYPNFAQKIANWTISNMKDEQGYFYYQKYDWFQIKSLI